MKAAVLCLCLLLLAVPAPAQEAESPPDTPPQTRPPEEMAREGVELLLRALRGFLQAVPHYGLPRLNERGDIIIPRLDREPAPEQEPGPDRRPEPEPDPDTGGIRT